MFIMSWNITSFYSFQPAFSFLAAATNPFLKFCINNSIIPGLFLVFYFSRPIILFIFKELVPRTEILFFFGGFYKRVYFHTGRIAYLFFQGRPFYSSADDAGYCRTENYITHLGIIKEVYHDKPLIKVNSYLETPFRLKPAVDVSHYTEEFVESMFRGHHFAAILSVFAAFLFLILIGFFLDYPFSNYQRQAALPFSFPS